MAKTKASPTEYGLAIERIKTHLKARKVTYAELAAGIGLSESGVKKIFTARDGSFQRVAEICRFAGLSIGDLLAETDQDQVEIDFTDKQQAAFLRDAKLFEFFWRLVYERAPLAEAKRAMKVVEKQAFAWLRQLDGLGLVQLLPGDRVVIPQVKPVSWAGRGAFIEKLYADWSERFVREAVKTRGKGDHQFTMRYFKMPPALYREFKEALRALETEFLRRSVREMRLEPPDLHHVRWLSAVDDRSYVGAKATE